MNDRKQRWSLATQLVIVCATFFLLSFFVNRARLPFGVIIAVCTAAGVILAGIDRYRRSGKEKNSP